MSTIHKKMSALSLGLGLGLVLSTLGCTQKPLLQAGANAMPVAAIEAAYTVIGEGGRATARVLTQAVSCPGIALDEAPAVTMALRAAPAIVATRSGGAQADNKEAAFAVLTCEAELPPGIRRARVGGVDLPLPRAAIERIVIVADTGCRMKASEHAFQDCNDAQRWPFARVMQSATATKPDLVIHIGDLHYRESPCPAGNTGCAGNPWGYGYDVWQADFFNPARPLLAAAPWVFVRGNHESCARAGQGWFRFLDTQPWSEARSCNDPKRDADADHSEPYAVPITQDTQLLVFDSSRTSGKPFTASDPAYAKYMAQMQAVERLTKQKANSLFMSHHPLLAFAPVKEPGQFKPGGNAGLQSVFERLYPERLFPEGVNLAMHGHVHLFEAISFKSAHPATLVLGNAGSANEGRAPDAVPAGAQAYKGAVVEDYAARSEFGFATLDRVDSGRSGDWLLTEYSSTGEPVIRCRISGGKSRCEPVRL